VADKTVVVVEDEENLLEALKYNLEREGYVVRTAADGETGLELARSLKPDLVILDLMLPKMDGIEVCRILRNESHIPILILTAKGEEVDRVVGLEMGADDYVVKPFSMRELLARVKATLRRSQIVSAETHPGSAGETLRSGDLEVDISSHTVRLAGTPLEMKPREFDLLALLVRNRGIVMTRDKILDALWGHDYIGDARTVDVHVRWLRNKIERDPANPERIVTIRTIGYRFEG
jgi:DNA-binding response OmpR family regulator